MCYSHTLQYESSSFLEFPGHSLASGTGERERERAYAAFAVFREIERDFFPLVPSEYRVSALPGIKKAKAILGAKALAEGTDPERDRVLEARLLGVHAWAPLSTPFLGRTAFRSPPTAF